MGLTDRAIAITLEGAPWVIQRDSRDTSGNALLARIVPNGPSGQRPFGSHLSLVAGLGLSPETNLHGFVRSSDRTTVLGFGRVDGRLPMRGFQHRDPVGTFTFELFDPLPSQVPVALSTGAVRMIDQTGVVFESTTGDRAGLAGLAPAGATMRGFSLANDGQFAYAYASRLIESGPALYRESQPLLLVFSLQGPGGALIPRLVQQINLTQPVNCRTAPAPQNECGATPHIVVDEFGPNAVVVGRDGMSVASLP